MSETPDAIPDDIDRIATDIVRTRYSEDVGEAEYLLYEAIAKAILAERGRCAKVAFEYDHELHGYEATDQRKQFYDSGVNDASIFIADAIRGGA